MSSESFTFTVNKKELNRIINSLEYKADVVSFNGTMEIPFATETYNLANQLRKVYLESR